LKKIIIVGLGANDEKDLTLGVWQELKEAKHLFLRTDKLPLVKFFNKEKVKYTSFDYLYEQFPTFSEVYEKIVEVLLENLTELNEEIVYAVPGHPLVAEKTVQLLLEAKGKLGIEIEILAGPSYIDLFLTRFAIDPLDGLLLLDGTALKKEELNPNLNMLIGQVYDQMVANEVKIQLLDLYDPDFIVFRMKNLGLKDEIIEEIPLKELDHQREFFNNFTTIYIPKTDDLRIINRTFWQLLKIIETLRGPNGCPWDRKQTHLSLRKYLIEEAYEFIEEIEQDNIEGMIEELGDLLLQVVLHAQIGKDDALFNIEDILLTLNNKLIYRHPHVFGEKVAKVSEEAENIWNEMKKANKKEAKSLLSEVKVGLPPLLKAYDLQKVAASSGFDWVNIEDVYQKIMEEIEEVRLAKEEEKLVEVGDLLFAVINLSRFLGINPEEALAKSNQKFSKRFQYIENYATQNGIALSELSLQEMDHLWNEAKSFDNSSEER